MTRLKFIITILLFMAALPVWRFFDMLTWLAIDQVYVTLALFVGSTLFIIAPITFIYRRFFIPGIALNICFAILVQTFSTSFSATALNLPEERHCSLLNFAGFFYPLRQIVPAAHEDDLLIRNQICWLRKLEISIPFELSKNEKNIYKELIEEKLFLPEIKWKTSLPFLIPIYLHFTDSGLSHVEAQKLWNEHYTAEVKDREYNLLSYPHSDYIKWEYGLIEKYWSKFLDGIVVQAPVKSE